MPATSGSSWRAPKTEWFHREHISFQGLNSTYRYAARSPLMWRVAALALFCDAVTNQGGLPFKEPPEPTTVSTFATVPVTTEMRDFNARVADRLEPDTEVFID